MLSAVLGPRGLEIQERPVPVPPPGEALVRVLLAGVCDTDLQLVSGYMGYQGVLGHEFVGRVESAATAPELAGRTVVGEINAACRRCPDCRVGLERHCPHRTVLGILGRDGAFAEYLVLPVENLHPVDDRMPLERAVFVEPVAAAFEILEQVPVRGRRALVVGCGKLGSLCARVLALGGADVVAMARTPETLADLAADGFATRLAGDPPAREFDLVVEATGDPDGFAHALRWLGPRGTLVLKTTTAGRQPLSLAPIVIDELTVVGSRCGPFPPAIDALARGDLLPERTIARRFPLARAAEALEAARRPEVPHRRKMILAP